MCKIVVIPKITDETRVTAQLFAEAIAQPMSKSDDDGFGYAAINTEGQLFGERWLKNHEAFKTRTPISELEYRLLKSFRGVLSKEIRYNTFGPINTNKDMKAITLHARMSTSGKGFQNTHPFVEGFTSVIHNGVITNADKLTRKYSTCDSEVILHEYIKQDVANKPKNIQKMVNKFEGYYAIAIFSRMNNGRVILDIFKDNRANLGAIWVEELQTIVIATDTDHIEKTATELQLTCGPKFEWKLGQLLRFDVATGEVINKVSFDPYQRARFEKEQSKLEEKVKEELEAADGNKKSVSLTHEEISANCRTLKMLPGLNINQDWVQDPRSKVWKKVKV